MMVKIEGKVHPRTGHEGPEGKKTYGSTLSLTLALDGGWVDSTMPWPLYPWERDPVHCSGDWVGPRAGLDGRGKLPDRPASRKSLY
jgi:hypothetical protein